MKSSLGNQSWLAPAFILSALCVLSIEAVQFVTTQGSSFGPQAGGNGNSGVAVINRDGHYVLFASTANNLTLTHDNNSPPLRPFNVYLRDRLAGTTTLVSVNATGNSGGNDDSFPVGISTDGQFALFQSSASDLTLNDTNNASDIFVRDLSRGLTALVSVSTNGGYGNGASRDAVMTPDGRYVAFVSAASNLVPKDTNNIPDVFVRDLQAGTTTLASVGAASNSSPPNLYSIISSESPDITADGRYVAFYSTATNLVSGVTNTGEIYVRDLVAGSTTWVSTNARAIAQSITGSANFISCNFALSDDGQSVAFEACTNTTAAATGRGIAMLQHLPTGLTDLLCSNAVVSSAIYENIHNLAITPDGRFTAYVANVSPTNTAIYLWDAQLGTNTLVSASLDNSGPASGFCAAPVISSNGQFVVFISSGTNLVANPLTGDWHVYLRDALGCTNQLLDVAANGTGAGVNLETATALSADGGVAVFDSATLLADNRRLNYNVFARDVMAGATDLISARHPALPSPTPNGISDLTPSSVSASGRFVVFGSDADDLAPNDTNGCRDVFVRDLATGANILVSVSTNGAAGNATSFESAISGDGRYVVFTSWANDLAPAGITNQNVFIRDLQANTTALVSINTGGTNSGNGDSFAPAISANGRYVLFHSKASNLAAGSFGSGIENLFCRDLQTRTNYALTTTSSGTGVYSASMTPDGQSVAFIGTIAGTSAAGLYVWNSQTHLRTYTNSTVTSSSGSPGISISPTGQRIAYFTTSSANLAIADIVSNTVQTINANAYFVSRPGLQFNSDGRFFAYSGKANSSSATPEVYLYDFQTGINLLVSWNFAGTVAATNSDSPVISPDGRFIAYRSFATNVATNDFNNAADLFLYNVSNHVTILVSVNASGNFTANDFSLKPVFSGDGQTLFLQSWATDLLSTNDFNNGSDVFALNLFALPGNGSTNAASNFYAQLIPSGTTPSGIFGPPLVSWPLASGKSYQVQFKDNLTDPVWQNVPGNPAFIGGTGYASDPAPASGQRFYRVVLTP